MHIALLQAGIVVDRHIADAVESVPGAVACDESVGIGWIYDGEVFSPPVPPASPVVMVDYEEAIQLLIDTTAREKLFRDGVTLASYTASTNAQWAAEALAFVAWRDEVWAYAYTELAKVLNAQRPQPTIAEFLDEITPINWPE